MADQLHSGRNGLLPVCPERTQAEVCRLGGLSCSGSPDAPKGKVISRCIEAAADGTTRTYGTCTHLLRRSSFKLVHLPCPGSLHSQNVQPLTGLWVMLIAAAEGLLNRCPS